MSELLTDDERAAIHAAGELWGQLCQIVGDGPTREADLGELVVHIHAIQQAVMAQAAARAYPELFRPLGRRHPSTEESEEEVSYEPTISDLGTHYVVTWPNGRGRAFICTPEMIESWAAQTNKVRAENVRLRAENERLVGEIVALADEFSQDIHDDRVLDTWSATLTTDELAPFRNAVAGDA